MLDVEVTEGGSHHFQQVVEVFFFFTETAVVKISILYVTYAHEQLVNRFHSLKCSSELESGHKGTISPSVRQGSVGSAPPDRLANKTATIPELGVTHAGIRAHTENASLWANKPCGLNRQLVADQRRRKLNRRLLFASGAMQNG